MSDIYYISPDIVKPTGRVGGPGRGDRCARTIVRTHPILPRGINPHALSSEVATFAAREERGAAVTDATFERTQEVFLPVHGHVRLLPKEVAVVDHPAFQRLRVVRQLGFAHLVFPGGSHSRFEHSIGAVHIAERIIQSVRESHARQSGSVPAARDWTLISIQDPVRRLIRLAALMHDIGHLPFGHTLEDELNHLRKHDGPERLSLIADRSFADYQPSREEFPTIERPQDGWSLKALINALYGSDVAALGIQDPAYSVLTAIVCKPPTDAGPSLEDWKALEARLTPLLPLEICRDIVGNTICADFLDYIFRDWYHLGKPHFEDKRLYEYMEARQPKAKPEQGHARFVINVGEPNKVRHDAITSILELLDARYKLAETVLFHRTKLALTGLLDRCLLETRELYERAGLSANDFQAALEKLLLESGDDQLTSTLDQLIRGGSSDGQRRLDDAIAREEQELARATSRSAGPALVDDASAPQRVRGALRDRQDLAFDLVRRLKGRRVYTLAYKLPMSQFAGLHSPENPQVKRIISLYSDPRDRFRFLSLIESLCRLPRGSVIMYCPPSAKMNAKIAKASLFVDGEVKRFDTYEEENKPGGLTCGALAAQVGRFYQLWSAQIFVDTAIWEEFDQKERNHLVSVFKVFFFQPSTAFDPRVERGNIEASVRVVSARALDAARAGSGDPASTLLAGMTFPSGLPYTAE